MSEDWLDIGEREGEGGHLPAVIALPDDRAARAVLAEQCWATLSDKQRMFLTALRQHGFNAREAARALEITGPSREAHIAWMHKSSYATVFHVWKARAAEHVKDPDGVLLRHDYIVEKALTPKPILHQGVATGYEEVELSVAARANEALLDRVMPKPREGIEVNIGVYTPVHVEVEKPKGEIIDATAEVVEVTPGIPE